MKPAPAILVCLLALGASAQSQKQQPPPPQQQQQTPRGCAVTDSYYPLRTCRVETSTDSCYRLVRSRAPVWRTIEECCTPGKGAFPQGCTRFDVNVTCFVASTFWPTQQRGPTSNLTRCSMNWGQWPSEAECCKPGNGFVEGCTSVRPDRPCWYPVENTWPTRACNQTSDQQICKYRGYQAYKTKEECCAPGKAWNEGCSSEDGVDV